MKKRCYFLALRWRVGTRGIAAGIQRRRSRTYKLCIGAGDLRRVDRRNQYDPETHLAVKGGRLAAAAHDATKSHWRLSDVPVGKESALASGPDATRPNHGCGRKARIIAEHALYHRFPACIASLA